MITAFQQSRLEKVYVSTCVCGRGISLTRTGISSAVQHFSPFPTREMLQNILARLQLFAPREKFQNFLRNFLLPHRAYIWNVARKVAELQLFLQHFRAIITGVTEKNVRVTLSIGGLYRPGTRRRHGEAWTTAGVEKCTLTFDWSASYPWWQL